MRVRIGVQFCTLSNWLTLNRRIQDLTSLWHETVLCGPYIHQLWQTIVSWLCKHKKAQWLLYVPLSLTHRNSTFCPHIVFTCFVCIWEQTAIISLYIINWLVCITETECVYCAVRTGSLYIIRRSAHTLYLCVLCGSENKQRLFPYTALTDWFL